MFTWYYFVIALACGSCNNINFQKILPFPWSDDAPMFIQWSVYYFHRKITYQRQLLPFWRKKHSTQNTFKGLENEATFSWNGLLPTFLLLERFSTYVVVSIYDKDLFWERAIQKSRIEFYNLSIYIIFSQQEQDIFYWNFCFFFNSDKPFDSHISCNNSTLFPQCCISTFLGKFNKSGIFVYCG